MTQSPSVNWIPVILAILLGGVFIFISIGEIYSGLVSPSWPKTEAVVIDSHSESATNGSRGSKAQISFRYKVGDIQYISHRFGFDCHSNHDDLVVDKILEKYPVGKATLAYYSPEHPDVAVLVPGLYRDPVIMFFIGLFISAIVLYSQFSGRPPHRQRWQRRQDGFGFTVGP